MQAPLVVISVLSRRALQVVALAAITLSPAYHAQAAKILTIGDSISYGLITTTNPNTTDGGFMTVLSGLLGPGNEFVGEYQDFTEFGELPWEPSVADPATAFGTWPGGSDIHHFALPGATISEGTTAMQDVALPDPDPLVDYVFSGQTLSQRLTAANCLPDIVIVHLGTNDINSGSTTEMSSGQIAALVASYGDLLAEVADQFPGANVLASMIIPKTPNSNNTPRTVATRNNVANLDKGIRDLVNDINAGVYDNDNTALGMALDSLQDRVALADLFGINVNDLAALGLSAAAQAAAQQDADEFVDWILNDLEDVDVPLVNTMNQQRNAALLPDGIHPTAAGYEIMGYALYDALLDAGFLVPEPGAFAILGVAGLGGVLLVRRRRHPAAA